MTVSAPDVRVGNARFVPWLVRFRRPGNRAPELQLERLDSDGADPRASTAAGDEVKVAVRGVFHDRSGLARELGIQSAPGSDAELVRRAYERWGKEGFRRLRGIFAVFVWDAERECLLAARDPLGVEPLLYARAGGELLFAPSPAILLAQPGVPRTPNRIALVENLTWRWPVPEDTYLEGIRRVLPGHILTVTDGTTTSSRYWDPLDDLQKHGWVEADELDRFDALLEQSVARCLELGPAGIFLSGGLDSASIAAVTLDFAERSGLAAPLALSLAFPTPEASEREVQVGVAKDLGLPQILLGLEESVAPDGLVGRAVELSADWPLPLTYIWSGAYQELARAGAERGVRVILTGAGGDEWLGVDLMLAADFMHSLQFRNLYRFVRSKLDSFDTPLSSSLRALLWTYGLWPIIRFHVRPVLVAHAPGLLHVRRGRQLAAAEPPWLAPDPKLRAAVRGRRWEAAERAENLPGRRRRGHFRFYMSSEASIFDHALISEDRENDFESGRRASVELLHPYWDPDLISFLYRVAPEHLLRGGREKGLVREAIARRFPRLGFERQKKNVSSDYQYSLIRHEGWDALGRLGGCTALADLGIVDGARVDVLLEEGLASSNRGDTHRVFQLLTLEAWARGLA